MNLINKIGHRIAAGYRAITNQSTGGYEMLVDPSRRGDAGVPVNRNTMLDYAPIYFSVSRISGYVGQVPKRVLVRDDDEITKVTRQNSSLPDLLNLQPNNFMSGMDMFESVQKDAINDGNGRVGIIRDAQGPTTLIPIAPAYAFCFLTFPANSRGEVTISEDVANGPVFGASAKWHYITAADGSSFVMPDSDVLHIKGLQPDGLAGIPLWKTGKNVIGGGLAAEKRVNKTMKSLGIPGLILQAPEGVLTDKDKANEFLETFRKHISGNHNAGNTALLRYGVTANTLSEHGRDGQLIENRKFSRDDAFLVTGDMAFYDGGSAYSNQEDRDEAFKNQTMARWLTKWEQECNVKLLTPTQRMQGWEIDFDEGGILRGSLRQRLEAYEIARRIGYLSQEEMRRRDGLPAPNPDENFTNPNVSSPFAESPIADQEETAAEEAAEEAAEDGGTDGDIDATNRSRIVTSPRLNGPGPTQLEANTRLSRWLRKERAKLLEFADEPETFINKAEAFYSGSEPKILSMSASIGCEPWHNQHREEILTACECSPVELYSSIDELTRDWPTTKAAILSGIIQVEVTRS